MTARRLMLVTCSIAAASAWAWSAQALPSVSRTQAAPDANSAVEIVRGGRGGGGFRGFSGGGFRGFSGRGFAGRSFYRPRAIGWGGGYRGFRRAAYWGGPRWYGPRRVAYWGPRRINRVRWYGPRFANWWPGWYGGAAYWAPSTSYYWGRGTDWGPSAYSYWRPRTVYWGAGSYPEPRWNYWSPVWGRGFGQARGWTGWR